MVDFVMKTNYQPSLNFQDDLGIAMGLEFYYQYMVDGVSPSYIEPVGGFVTNGSIEYAAITWTDIRTQPTYSFLSVTVFNFWKTMYRSQVITFGIAQDVVSPLIASKASSSDLSSAVGTLNTAVASKADTSSVNTALSTKVNGKSNMYLHEAQATSDSSSVVTIHLTVDGLSTGAALFSGAPKVVATGKDSTGSPIASPQVAELAWSNSNKTVTFKTSRATNMLLLGNSAVATGAGAVVDVIAYGTKA